MAISKEFSTYLDSIRFNAALAVVASHFAEPQFVANPSYPEAIGNVAVAWFFVLSGYVIAYVANEKETTLKQFAVSRLARVYSVAAPALLLTLTIDFYLINSGVRASDLSLYEFKKLWKYLPVFLVFGSEVGGFQAQVFGNGPFWSLSYEVWYYVAFAMFFFFRGKLRFILGAVATIFLGPQALIYFPIWLLGGALYTLPRRFSIAPNIAAIGVVASVAVLIGLFFINAYDSLDSAVNAALHGWPRLHLHNSARFPSFYTAGLLAATNIFFAQYCKFNCLSGHRIRRYIAYLASFTFAIYLSHWPLMNELAP